MKTLHLHKVGDVVNGMLIINCSAINRYQCQCIRCGKQYRQFGSNMFCCKYCKLHNYTARIKNDIVMALEMYIGQGKQIKQIADELGKNESQICSYISTHFFGKNQKKLKLQSKINYELHQSNT